MTEIKEIVKGVTVESSRFRPCVTVGTWLVSRLEATHTDTKKVAVYIFGTDAIEATMYNRNNSGFNLNDLALNTAKEHIEKDLDKFPEGTFRFEFDGVGFNFCEEEPKWATYDCGVWE